MLSLSLLFAFAGCGGSDDVDEGGEAVQLTKPSVSITTTTSSSFKAAWDAVDGATGYKYYLAQENESGNEILERPEATTSATGVAFDNLQPSTKYILKVKALSGNSAVADSSYAKVFATTLSEHAAKLTFDKIAVSDATYESVVVDIVPAADDIYYFAVVEYSKVANKSDDEVIELLSAQINQNDLVSGNIKRTVHGLTENTRYTVVAFGWNGDKGVATSDVARLGTPFVTLTDDRMTIGISVDAVSSQNATVSFTPSAKTQPYYADVVLASQVQGLSDEEVVEVVKQKNSTLSAVSHTGNYTGNYTVDAGTEYVAVAFGYDTTTSALSTKLATQSFTSSQIDMFQVTVSNATDSSFDVAISPTDKNMYYVALSAPTAILSSYSLDYIADYIVTQSNSYCSEYGFDTCVSYGVFISGDYTDTFDGMDPETAYTVFVMGVEKESSTSVKAATGVTASESITTLAVSTERSDAFADITSVVGQATSSYGLAMFALFTCNSSTSSLRCAIYKLQNAGASATSLSDLGMTEDDLRAAAIGSDGTDVNLTKCYIGTYVDLNTPYLITCVAKDANGLAGHPNWVIVKTGATMDADITTVAESERNGTAAASLAASYKSASYSDYLGNWTLTSAGSFELSDSSITSSSTPLTFHLRIEQNEEGKSYKVYGWSVDSDFGNAHPFVMNYDDVESNGISGWLYLSLAQTVATIDGVNWLLAPRFIYNNSYYYYGSTDMTKAFYGAMKSDGSVIIVANSYTFSSSDTSSTQLSSMSYVGVDSSTSSVQLLSTETAHAMAPYTLVKEGSSTTSAKKATRTVPVGRSYKSVNRAYNLLARFSSAASMNDIRFTDYVRTTQPRLTTVDGHVVTLDPKREQLLRKAHKLK